MAKVIRNFNTAFGGLEFRATSDGSIVRLQKLTAERERFKTIVTMSVEQYEELESANDHQLDNPAWFSAAIEEEVALFS